MFVQLDQLTDIMVREFTNSRRDLVFPSNANNLQTYLFEPYWTLTETTTVSEWT